MNTFQQHRCKNRIILPRSNNVVGTEKSEVKCTHLFLSLINRII